MFVVSRQTEYALFLINFLKDKDGPVSLSEIARACGLSLRFLAKAAARLKSAKILASKEGAGGGYWLKVNPEKISLWQVISLFEKEKRIVSCFSNKKEKATCMRRCHLKKFWHSFEKELIKKLKQIQVKQILN